MKSLFLLRHAHASNNIEVDFDRELSNEGVLKCQNIAKNLQAYIKNIDLILCSSAVRTTQTIQNILSDLNITKINVEYRKDLYTASVNQLYELLRLTNEKEQNILLLSHNPAISDLGRFLANNNKEILQGFSPGSLALYHCNVNSWDLLDQNNITLNGFWR